MGPILIVSRPKSKAGAFADRVRAASQDVGVVILSPALTIEAVAPSPLLDAEHLIFTSSTGVERAQDLALKGPHAICVGRATTQAALDAGYDARQAGNCADDLVATVLAHPPDGPMLHVCGEHTRGAIVERLTQAGLSAERMVTYAQIAQTLTPEAKDALRGNRAKVLPVFSPRSAALFEGAVMNGPFHFIAMSDAVANNLPKIALGHVTIAEAPTENNMIAATAAALVKFSQETE